MLFVLILDHFCLVVVEVVPHLLYWYSEANEAVLQGLADINYIVVWHFSGLDALFGASLVRCDLNPLPFLLLGDVDTFSHEVTHVLEIIIVAALPTPGRYALALSLFLMARLATLVSADIVVFDHSGAHGVLKHDLLIIICKGVVVYHVV